MKKIVGVAFIGGCLYVAPVQTLAVLVLLGIIAFYVMMLSKKQLPDER